MKRSPFGRAVRRAGIVGAGLLAALAGPGFAEIVSVASPPVLAPGAAPVADGGPGAAAEIVPAAKAPAEIVPANPRAQKPRPAAEVVDHDGAVPAGKDPQGRSQSVAGTQAAVQVPPTPQRSANIRWPLAPALVDAADADAADASVAPADGVEATESGATTHTSADGESPRGPEDAFDRALAVWQSEAGPRSQGVAARWFRVAADAGDPRAAIAYAYLQGLGLGVTRDPVAARRTLQQASQAGVPRADYLLSLLAAADRRPGSERQQGELRERAARGNDPAAQNAMGVHYQLQGDRTTAEMWYRRAADNGSPAARLNLAGLADRAEADQPSDTPAETAGGDADSLFERAQRHHRGDGVPVDYGLALRLYRQAAAKGSEPAQQMLGLIQSRTLPDGGFDPVWMRQLASAAVGKPGSASLVPSVAPTAQPRLDDPLIGLAGLMR